MYCVDPFPRSTCDWELKIKERGIAYDNLFMYNHNTVTPVHIYTFTVSKGQYLFTYPIFRDLYVIITLFHVEYLQYSYWSTCMQTIELVLEITFLWFGIEPILCAMYSNHVILTYYFIYESMVLRFLREWLLLIALEKRRNLFHHFFLFFYFLLQCNAWSFPRFFPLPGCLDL